VEVWAETNEAATAKVATVKALEYILKYFLSAGVCKLEEVEISKQQGSIKLMWVVFMY
jgi:hypothetical protein